MIAVNYQKKLTFLQIEAMVFKKLVEKRQELTAKAYEGYRSVREFQRENYDPIDSEVLGLIEDANEEIKDEMQIKTPY